MPCKSWQIDMGAAPMPFIIGAPRSGTTLLRLMLDANPCLALPPETGFLMQLDEWLKEGDLDAQVLVKNMVNYPTDTPVWKVFGIEAAVYLEAVRAMPEFDPGNAVRCFYQLYATRLGKSRWGDKTPGYGFYLDAISRLLPEAHFIHLIRDGRDVAASWRQTWFAPSQDWRALGDHWTQWITTIRRLGAQVPHYMEVRYEELVNRPEETLRGICAFIDLDFDAAMLKAYQRAPERLRQAQDVFKKDGTLLASKEQLLKQQWRNQYPPDASRVLAWKEALSELDRRAFEETAGELLVELGYEPPLC
jgi:hypothetical protein